MFELIHPENRIVLDYGKTRELYLLAVINTDGGQEYDIYSNRFEVFSKVKRIDNRDEHMTGMVEGVVVKTGSHRFKVKTGEYLRLHRIATEFTPKRVWEALKDGDSLEFKNMPEEFDAWLNATIKELKDQFRETYDAAVEEYKRTKDMTDKEVGVSQDFKYKGLVFMLRNKKDVFPTVWKMVKPKKEVVRETIDA